MGLPLSVLTTDQKSATVAGEFDLPGSYCVQLDRCYRLAKQYEFGATLAKAAGP